MSIIQLLFSAKGRVPRRTIWLYTLAVDGVLWIFAILFNRSGPYAPREIEFWLCLTFLALVVATFILVCIKRLHDRNHPGWNLWFFFVPLINILLIIDLYLSPGSDGKNDYGFPILQQS